MCLYVAKAKRAQIRITRVLEEFRRARRGKQRGWGRWRGRKEEGGTHLQLSFLEGTNGDLHGMMSTINKHDIPWLLCIGWKVLLVDTVIESHWRWEWGGGNKLNTLAKVISELYRLWIRSSDEDS